MPAAKRLRLAIGLPARDPQGLSNFLARAYDPASPDYRHYLTPRAFTEKFGPTEAEYAAVIRFAQTNGLTVAATHGNRLLLDVDGTVADIQRAFHITLNTYRHPTEAREFYAPDADPSVEAALPVADVSGLSNYALPRPRNARLNSTGSAPAGPKTGSGPSGDYMGNDFRAAYLPDVTLTGAGQTVGLAQFDGFYADDISAYETEAGLPAVPIQTVLLDGYDGLPMPGTNDANAEVSLDIELTIAMAPGLSGIVVFEVGPNGLANDLLSAMAASNQIQQFSCSWGWSGGPSATTDAILQQMAAQGQSFFNASGDSDAFTLGGNSSNGVDNPSLSDAPASSPYLTQVGGTTLATSGAGGAWSSESAWNRGASHGQSNGTSGGVSSHYPIPNWQTTVDMSANGGSTAYRNIPDVAMVAENVYVRYANGWHGAFGGTSCASPLWAGLAALINQQAAAAGLPPIGWINPAVYALGASSLYGASFHDITVGDNISASSPNEYYAVAGYDLCTGWGSPSGQGLIDALAGPRESLRLIPATGWTASGPVGGPFDVSADALLLTNAGSASLVWSLSNTSAWLSVSSNSGALSGGAAAALVLGLTPVAASLGPGTYWTTLLISNETSQAAQGLSCALEIRQALVRNGGFESGDFSGWTLVGNSVDNNYIYDVVEGSLDYPLVVHSGTFGAFMGDTQLATLSQTLRTVPGQNYLLSLWLDNPKSSGTQTFIVRWNTNSPDANELYRLSSPPVLTWTNLVFLVPAAGSNTVLQIAAQNNDNYFGVDDISLTPLPALEFQSALPSGNDLLLTWAAATGLVYQVQYTTGLAPAHWTNLGAAFIATNSTATVSDPDALLSARQRFYRFSLRPGP